MLSTPTACISNEIDSHSLPFPFPMDVVKSINKSLPLLNTSGAIIITEGYIISSGCCICIVFPTNESWILSPVANQP